MPKVAARKPRIISLDCETTGVDLRHGAKAFIVTSCDEQGVNKFWQWDVYPLTREPEIVYEDLAEIQELIDSADRIVGQYFKFDYTALQRIFLGELHLDWDKVDDTLQQAHLLGSNEPKDLGILALMRLGVNIKPYEDRLEKAVIEARRLIRTKTFIVKHGEWRISKKGLPEMPSAKEETWRFDYWLPRAVCQAEGYADDHPWWTVAVDYANVDSAVTLPLYVEQKRLIEAAGLLPLYRESIKLPEITYGMEEYGMSLSESRTTEIAERYTNESEEAGQLCRNIAATYDYELTLPKSGSNGSLSKFIFEVMQLPVVKQTDGGNPSLDKDARAEYAVILDKRTKPALFMRTLGGKSSRDTAVTYLNSYLRYRLPTKGEWFRLHSSYNQTGSRTLRWSCQNPNAENVSKKEDFNLRYAFGPMPGRVWYSIDYDNLELRIPGYESGERAMIEIFENPDQPPYFGSYHLMNASIIYPDEFWPLAEQEGAFKSKYKSTLYQWTKNFGFAIGYGAIEKSGTADRAAHKVGAQRMVQDQLKEHSRLNQYWIDFANRHGYVETMPDKSIGCKRGYPLQCPRGYRGKVKETVPLNYHVQGTAGWVIRKAMVRCRDVLRQYPDHHMIAQLHDELDFDFPSDYDNGPILDELKSEMEKSGDDIGIPLKVSVAYHPNNWSEEGEPIHA